MVDESGLLNSKIKLEDVIKNQVVRRITSDDRIIACIASDFLFSVLPLISNASTEPNIHGSDEAFRQKAITAAKVMKDAGYTWAEYT